MGNETAEQKRVRLGIEQAVKALVEEEYPKNSPRLKALAMTLRGYKEDLRGLPPSADRALLELDLNEKIVDIEDRIGRLAVSWRAAPGLPPEPSLMSKREGGSDKREKSVQSCPTGDVVARGWNPTRLEAMVGKPQSQPGGTNRSAYRLSLLATPATPVRNQGDLATNSDQRVDSSSGPGSPQSGGVSKANVGVGPLSLGVQGRAEWIEFATVEAKLKSLDSLPTDLLRHLEEINRDLLNLARRIVDLPDESVEDGSSVQDHYLRWLANLRKHWTLLSNLSRQLVPTVPVQGEEDISSASLSHSSRQSVPQTLLLPKTGIEKFDGSRGKWLSFRRDLVRLLDAVEYSEAIRFGVLTQAVEGCKYATSVVRRHSKNWNLKAAAEDLIQYYEEPTRLLRELEEYAKAAKKMTDPATTEDWEDFFILVLNVEEQLDLADAEPRTRASLAATLRTKLPESARYVIEKKHNDFVEFKNFVERLWQAEMAMPAGAPATPAASKSIGSRQFGRANPKERNVAAVTSDVSTKPKIVAREIDTSCVFCPTDEHVSKDCPKTVSERKNRIYAQRLCFRCLVRTYPHSERCQEKCPMCHRGHHLLLCPDLQRARSSSPLMWSDRGASGEMSVAAAETRNVGSIQASSMPAEPIPVDVSREIRGTPVRQLIKCYLMSQGQMRRVHVFLDGGSEVTLVDPDLVQQLNLRVARTAGLVITGPGCGPQLCRDLTAFRLVSESGTAIEVVQGYLYSELRHVVVPPLPSKLVERAKELGVHLPEIGPTGVVPDIIIGVDYLDRESFTATEMRRLSPSVVAFRLPFGWASRGFYEHELSSSRRHVASYTVQIPECPCLDLKNILGLMPPEESFDKTELEVVYDEKERRFVVKLPWIGGRRPSNNFSSARGQAIALRKRLMEGGLLEAYHKAISGFVEAGYAEPAKPRFVEDGYYLPHHPVVKPEASKTKVRPVFNGAAAVRGGDSLNRCLSRGMPINCDLSGSVINLRLASIPLVSDLVKAFLQVRVKEEDRNYLRYFWFQHVEDPEPMVYRMTSLLFGANCSPNVLGMVLSKLFEDHRHKFPALQAATSTIYMDDIVTDVESVDQLEDVMCQMKELLSIGSFSMHECVTTEAVRQACPNLSFQKHEESKTVKCLGVQWNVERDEIVVDCKAEVPGVVTRRGVLSHLARLYDPLDLTLPFKVKARLFCRRLSVIDLGWDEHLPSELEREFFALADEYRALQVVVPRGPSHSPAQLVIFTDASMDALGAVAYVIDQVGNWVLLCARGRLTPMKKDSHEPLETISKGMDEAEETSPTIHRWELSAAVMGAEMFVKLSRSPRLRSVPCTIYSDSQVTLYRILKDHHIHSVAFVQNRLERIRKLTDRRVKWRFVSSEHNPADKLTHPMDATELMQCALWWRGPETSDLEEDQATWAKTKFMVKDDGEPIEGLAAALEVAENAPARSCGAVSGVPRVEAPPTNSIWTRILALPYEEARAEVRKMIQTKNKSMDARNQGKTIHHHEESYCRLKLWRAVQRQLFGSDYLALVGGRRPKDYRLRREGAFADEWRVIRMWRDLSPSQAFAVRFPILLDRHPMVESFIMAEHRRLLHPGVGTLVGHLLDEFFIYGCKRLVRLLGKTCRECLQIRGPFFSAPRGPLPFDRITEAETPFSSVGLDYFGPVLIVRSRKIYGLIFACNRTRAIHLEPVTSLATTNCVMAIQRFVARRGIPDTIRSDNATTFKSANDSLIRLAKLAMEASRDPALRRYEIKWLFNAPMAPWWGGPFERLIGTVKRKLEHINWRGQLSLEAVWTVFSEVESIINSRPLVGQDSLEPPLTPSHFLVGRKLTALPSTPVLPHPGPVLDNYYKIKEVTGEYWSRWIKEYINTLRRERRRVPNARMPEVGEIVLVQDAPKPRGQWPVGRIVATHPGADGIVRRVTVKMENGGKLERAIQALVPLEAMPVGPRPPREDVASHGATTGAPHR